MRKFILAALSALMLTACRTTDGVSIYSPDNKPTVVTPRSKPQAKAAEKAIFTRPALGFKVTQETPTRILLSKYLPANVNDNNSLKHRTKGRPLAQVELTFRSEGGKTRVTADNGMLLNPYGTDKDKFNLLQISDGRRLKKKLNELG
ncbi:MAG: hypothetical protein K5905_01555 [Roseibium sp.]|uniref:hypothetical protein n=1 Tax=Roseibium sp. TaxID=1936156 RepID=UPI0026268ED1|nr:hypothetical protein [Roseibium sp.]MCV0424136.1 hypothetical protein [Roseibium sp.]